jgi:hypothetical protein
MINKKVTIVLGAGASYPYGFPLGGELKDKIIDQILFSRQPISERDSLGSFLDQFGYKEDIQKDFALQLKESMHLSVDAFLFEHHEFIEIGKLSIAANLIRCERKDDLMSTASEGESRRKWYAYLLSLMGNREEFKSNNLSIITFNYDRSLEYFLYYTLKPRFNLSEQERIEHINSIQIVHVYGQLGQLHFTNENGRDYASLLNYGDLKKGAEGTSLIHEKNNEEINSENLKAVHRIIGESELLVFLGFGYLEENIRRLKLKEYYKPDRIVGTFFGMEDGEVSRAKNLIKEYSNIGLQAHIEDHRLDVYGFLRRTDFLR